MKEGLFAAHHELEERHWWFRARRRALREIGMALLPTGGRILDAGCGTGADVASFPTSYERLGIDESEAAIGFAKQRHTGVHFQVGRLPGVDGDPVGGADLVLLCDVLEHVERDREFMEWLIEAMKPGAYLLMTVPADPRLWSPHDEVYGHFRRYTLTTLAEKWTGLPVSVRLQAPFNRILYPVARLMRTIARRRGRSFGSERSDLSLPWAPLNWLLEQIFALEIAGLRAALGSEIPGRGPDGSGVSIITVLRKEG